MQSHIYTSADLGCNVQGWKIVDKVACYAEIDHDVEPGYNRCREE